VNEALHAADDCALTLYLRTRLAGNDAVGDSS